MTINDASKALACGCQGHTDPMLNYKRASHDSSECRFTDAIEFLERALSAFQRGESESLNSTFVAIEGFIEKAKRHR